MDHAHEVRNVIADTIDVGILAVIQDFDVTICTIEFSMQSFTYDLLIEHRSFAEQIVARLVTHLVFTGRGIFYGNTADNEFLVKAVATFLEITAVGHLCHQVRSTNQMPANDVARVVQFDLVEI